VVAASKNPSPKAILHGFLSVTVKVSELLQQFSLRLPVTIDAHKMPQDRHFGAGPDTMQQVHGASVKNNELLLKPQ